MLSVCQWMMKEMPHLYSCRVLKYGEPPELLRLEFASGFVSGYGSCKDVIILHEFSYLLMLSSYSSL